MAKKKQVNQTARIAEAVDWVDAALEGDQGVSANDELKKALEVGRKYLMNELLNKARASGTSGAARGRGGKKERPSAQEPPASLGEI